MYLYLLISKLTIAEIDLNKLSNDLFLESITGQPRLPWKKVTKTLSKFGESIQEFADQINRISDELNKLKKPNK